MNFVSETVDFCSSRNNFALETLWLHAAIRIFNRVYDNLHL